MKSFIHALGMALRDARRRAGFTLSDVQERSRSRFKPSAVGGYERGERTISVERFVELAEVYGVAPDRLLGSALEQVSPEGRRSLSINLSRLAQLENDVARRVAESVHRVKAQRGDYLTDVITLRSGDVEVLALESRVSPRTLISGLRPALLKGNGPLEDKRSSR